MLRLVEVPEVSFCDCKIFIGTDNEKIGNNDLEHARCIFSDSYKNTILDKSHIIPEQKKG